VNLGACGEGPQSARAASEVFLCHKKAAAREIVQDERARTQSLLRRPKAVRDIERARRMTLPGQTQG